MRLKRFRVTMFRSVEDSGWINSDRITTLVGTNESGKTNMMVPLWKLNPTENCGLDMLQDMPRKRYHSLRNSGIKPVFITGDFEMAEDELKKVQDLAGSEDVSMFSSVYVGRNYSGDYFVEFNDKSLNGDFLENLNNTLTDLLNEIAFENFDAKREQIENTVTEMLVQVTQIENVLTADSVSKLYETFKAIDTEQNANLASVRLLRQMLSAKHKCMAMGIMPEIKKYILSIMPKFVYYSSYGNIDSEIYLPQVIENFERQNLGVKEAAKVRTLKMLFEFVKLDPVEIYNLGKEGAKSTLSEEQIKVFTKQKKEREVLLQSAATEFTNRFRNWWKQGNYTFDFQADGDFFRIWVSDDLRSDKIELESRSTGLQWFFSFYLTFLTQSENKHQNTILLLDEPGLTLHPLAQEDLFNFFEGLSDTNQIVYSTHSPFMIDPGHLSRIVAVYVDGKGNSVVSTDLRSSLKESQIKSVYPVHSAINMLISNTALSGCIPIIVESVCDQILLNTLRTYLVSQGQIKANRDIVFIPSGSVTGIKAIMPLLVGRNTFMPYVILPNTVESAEVAKELTADLFSANPEHVIILNNLGMENATVEDFIPQAIMERMIVRYVPKSPYAEEEFEDVFKADKSLMTQVYDFIKRYEIELPKDFRESLAKRCKAEIIKRGGRIYESDKQKFNALCDIFTRISKF